MPADIPTLLLMIGATCSGVGAIILGWRVKAILDWVRNVLVAHEISIEQLRRLQNNEPQTEPIVHGTTKHLLDVEDKLGFVLLVAGFFLLGAGMLSTAGAYALRLMAANSPP